MAYAALIILKQTLEEILHPHQQIQSLMEKTCQLLDFLENSSENCYLRISDFEGKMIDAAYKGEDVLATHLSRQIHMSSSGTIDHDLELEIKDLQKIIEEFEFILDSVSKIKRRRVVEPLQPPRKDLTAGPSRISSSKKSAMVRLDEDFIPIKEQLTGSSSHLEIISIVGMGGIGKTTLATNLYNDSYIDRHFDILAWATLSQDYQYQQILRDLLNSMRYVNDELDNYMSIDQLENNLYKSLKSRRYLIVMDDVWDTKAWEDVKSLFPDDNNGSRIILTTRLSEVALYANSFGSIHHMSLLSLEDSWNLLCEKVFGEQSCPPEFEKIGKQISQNCKGLPLAIVVIGGLLSRGNLTQDYWRYIASNVKSALTENDNQLMEILSLSYNYLPHHLKACFLYMGVFPEAREIKVSRLIKLWVAEGFLKPHNSENLEVVAENYLKDLVDRNLIMVRKTDHQGGIKRCIIHDILRDLCVNKAREEKFLLVHRSRGTRDFPEIGCSEYRVSIHSPIYSIGKHDSRVRSLLYLVDYFPQDSSFFVRFRLLKVFNAESLGFDFGKFPMEIGELVHLRYLHIFCGSNFELIATTIAAKLKKLQTLILKTDVETWCLPLKIWEMQELRHLLLNRCLFPFPLIKREMKNLYTLSAVRNLICRKEVFQMMPNLKKLKIFYRLKMLSELPSCDFDSLVYLHKLETLEIWFRCSGLLSSGLLVNKLMNFVFPRTLKKLALYGCWISWNNMTIVGSLPNLEVLKIDGSIYGGTVWEPNEGEFLKLKYLRLHMIKLKEWMANEEHFPSLEHLNLSNCHDLLEIPYEFGNIPNFQMIEILNCNDSIVRSAMQIEEEQRNLGNDNFKVRVISKYEDTI